MLSLRSLAVKAPAAFPQYARKVSTDAFGATAVRSDKPGATDDDIKITLPENSFEYYMLGEKKPELEIHLSKKELLNMFREMVLVRRLEMAADTLYKAKKIHGFCHLSTGQEAVAIGINEARNEGDSIITSYRCHGFEYVCGASVNAILAELMGRSTGVSKGKGGSMHMYAKDFYGGNGIVGAQVPLGLGLAFSHMYKEEPNVTYTLYGDGAANQGQVFEAYNMAKLWDIPCVFACENNKYGMGTSASRSSALTKFYERGQYIPGLKVNAMDVLSVYSGSKFAREFCLAGHGPIVLEYETYRYGGHSMSDPGTTYRTREEIQQMRTNRDVITGMKQRLLDFDVCSEEDIKGIEKEVRAIVDKEVKDAEAAPIPEATPEVLFADTYLKGTEPEWVRGRTADEIHYFPRA